MAIRATAAHETEAPMFIVFGLLFLAGMYLFGLAFTLESWQALVFAAGILCITIGIALPIHFGRAGK